MHEGHQLKDGNKSKEATQLDPHFHWVTGLFQKKPKQGGVEDILFVHCSEFLGFLLYIPLEIPDRTKLHPQKLHKIVLHSSEILRPETTKTPGEIPHDFFLITPGNSTLFLINTWKFHLLFLQYPWKFHILNSPRPPSVWFLEWPIPEKIQNSREREGSCEISIGPGFLKWNFQGKGCH